ncbi:MAG: hypothetical protein H7Z21_18220, partial [Hymenobacter sp.]|nr:hypothetical protein [Hymenobacter sp.]
MSYLLLLFLSQAKLRATGQPAPLVAGTCPPQAGLYPRLDSSSAAPLTRYLARAVAMNGLLDEILPMPVAWNQTRDGRPCYTGGPPDSPASYVDSLACGERCTFAYCPENFAADVALLVQLKASFVQFAATTWDQPERFAPNSDYLKAAAQTVERINAAYDCAGVPRPFIQASVLENLNAGRTCAPPATPCEPWMQPGPPGTNSGIREVPLPMSVIEEFRDEIRRSPADSAYYLDAVGRPRPAMRFAFARVAFPHGNDEYAPDATKLEGRMWLFYQATCYIDRGYTSLHMGQPMLWAKLRPLPVADRPAALHQVGLLLARIRR